MQHRKTSDKCRIYRPQYPCNCLPVLLQYAAGMEGKKVLTGCFGGYRIVSVMVQHDERRCIGGLWRLNTPTNKSPIERLFYCLNYGSL